MVVKKNKSVLSNLIKDLKKIGPLLSEIPALIIDDESDQASVNTTDPKKWEDGKVARTAINSQISQLLTLLPRAQYVGYTATPFANVFVDPGDGEDIFPRDFLISLPRPTGYMGVQDFHDLDSTEGTAEETHIRGIYEDTGDRLQEALDAFVLTGALKLYRADHGVDEGPFRHHTMLVHESVRMAEHAALALRINSMWHRAAYTSQQGHDRLAALLASDFHRFADDGLPSPESYDELKGYVSRARQLINAGGTPVLVVNGDTERDYAQPELDFDRTPHVWKILVGGTKLSRGFTVEGLTVTYYRRTTQQADTLMQMGRWFGFRPGYRDLVRLYIGREEAMGKSRTVDLYEAFEAVCRDEETFRTQLTRYATLVDGRPQVTPAQIPPLVSQHLSWLRPAARNKMFNAELVEIRSPGQPIEPAAYPLDRAATGRNTERWRPLLSALTSAPLTLTNPPDSTSSVARSFSALTTTISHKVLLSILGGLEWERPELFRPHLTYLSQLDGRLAKVDDWLVIAPQLSRTDRAEASIVGSPSLSLARRSRQAGKAVFGRISGVEHRTSAQRIIDETDSPDLPISPATGVMLLYPVVEGLSDAETSAAAPHGVADPSKITMAFTLIPPLSAIDSTRQLLRFQARDSSHTQDVIVSATSL